MKTLMAMTLLKNIGNPVIRRPTIRNPFIRTVTGYSTPQDQVQTARPQIDLSLHDALLVAHGLLALMPKFTKADWKPSAGNQLHCRRLKVWRWEMLGDAHVEV